MTDDRSMNEAIDWFTRLQSGDATDTDIVEHAEWLAIDTRHQTAYGSLVDKWTGMEIAADFARQRIADLAASERQSQWRRLLAWPQAAYVGAAAVAVLVVAIGTWMSRAVPDVFVTGAGEQQSLILADGSTVHLNTKSEIAVRITGKQRVVDLRAGEALFEVERNPTRSFVVNIGAGRVEVWGTSFNVYRSTDQSVVTVVDGRIVVAPEMDMRRPTVDNATVLTGGQQVALTGQGMISEVRVADVAGVTAWLQGRLHFDGVPLAAAAAEIERYFEERIVVSDDVAEIEVVANIRVRSLDLTLGFLEEILPMKVIRVSKNVVRLEPDDRVTVNPS